MRLPRARGARRMALRCRFRGVYDGYLTSLATAFTILSLSFALVSAHPFHVDHTDKELEMMDTESLLHVEGDLRQQNKMADKRVSSLHGRIEKARTHEHTLEKVFKKLESGRDWEVRQTLNKEKELARAKAELQTKHEQMARISAHADEIRKRIRTLEAKMLSVSLAKEAAEVRYANPTILDVIDGKIEQLGNPSMAIWNKTLHSIVYPGLQSGSASVQMLRHHMRGSTQHVAIASTFAIYAFLLSVVALLFRAYRRVTGGFTLSRMMFAADLSFSSFWIFVALWSFALMDDPLTIMLRHNEATLVAVQLILGVTVIWYLFIRCVSLAATFKLREAFELIASLFVIQHYFEGVFTPSFTNTKGDGGSWTYFGYGLGHLILAARRARSQVLGAPKKDAIDPFRSLERESTFFGVWSQMKHLALAVEAILFVAISSKDKRRNAIQNGPQYEPASPAVPSREDESFYSSDYEDSDDEGRYDQQK